MLFPTRQQRSSYAATGKLKFNVQQRKSNLLTIIVRNLAQLSHVSFLKVHGTPGGCPKVATFLDSDENFTIYGRFGYLQSRLLLEKRDELQRLEQELKQMDHSDSEEDENNLKSPRYYTEDFMRERIELLLKVEKTWSAYGEANLSFSHS